MAVSSINTIVRDIIDYNIKSEVIPDNVLPVLRYVQNARRNLYKEYDNFLADQSVLKQMRQVQTDIDDQQEVTEEQLRQAFDSAMEAHQTNIFAFKHTDKYADKVAHVTKKWDYYNKMKEVYLKTAKLRAQLYSTPARTYNNKQSLQAAMIYAIQAIERARNCFQEPVKYSIAFVDDTDSGSNTIKEGVFTLSDLIKNNHLTLSINSGTSSFESALGINLTFNREILNSLNNSITSSWLKTRTDGPNRGWKYEHFKRTGDAEGSLPLGKQNNMVWSAGPDLTTPEGVPLQAKFIGFTSWGTASLHLSSLNSILVSLATYETWLQNIISSGGKNINVDTDTLYNQFRAKILKKLKKYVSTTS